MRSWARSRAWHSTRAHAGAGRAAAPLRPTMFGFAAPAARSARGFATVAGAAARQLEEAYAAPLQHVHWLMAGGTLAAFGLVQAAQRSEGKVRKDARFAVVPMVPACDAQCSPTAAPKPTSSALVWRAPNPHVG